MGKVLISGGAGGGVSSDELTATSSDVIKGKTAVTSDSDDEIIVGTLELTGNTIADDVIASKEFYNTDPKNKVVGTLPEHTGDIGASNSFLYSSSYFMDIPKGAYRRTDLNGAGGRISRPQSTVATDLGITSAKLVSGQTICGVSGDAWNVWTGDSWLDASRLMSGYSGWSNGVKVVGTLTINSVVSFSVAPYSTSQVLATWQWPSKGPYSTVYIQYKEGGYPANAWDGVRGYTGTGSNSALGSVSTAIIGGLTAGHTYYFRIWVVANSSIGELMSGYLETTCTVTNHGQQVLTSSGIWYCPSGVRTIDVFLVGGGTGGQGGEVAYSASGGCGGGSGYTTTALSLSVTPGQGYNYSIGAGSSGGGGGSIAGAGAGATTFASHSAQGAGLNGYKYGAGDGGSGGGGGSIGFEAGNIRICGGAGGTDGANGNIGGGPESYEDGLAGGDGSNQTTRAFKESWNTIYAGGGGGGCNSSASGSPGPGGSGGGGSGGRDGGGSAGTPNTGSGGGGGGARGTAQGYSGGNGASGVIIVRW